MADDGLVGRWRLVAWTNRQGDEEVKPLGDDPQGVLLYGADGSLAVQITGPDRAPFPTPDPLGGSLEEQAGAYSTCLAYSGRYERHGDTVVHEIELSLFPNWVGARQTRSVELSGDELILRTPPIEAPGGPVVGELRWARD